MIPYAGMGLNGGGRTEATHPTAVASARAPRWRAAISRSGGVVLDLDRAAAEAPQHRAVEGSPRSVEYDVAASRSVGMFDAAF